MTQTQTEAASGTKVDVLMIEDGLKSLWERVRYTSDLIQQLRNDRRVLQERIRELEREVAEVHRQSEVRDAEMKRYRAEYRSQPDHESFTPEEKEHLKTRIKELIAKINSYL